MQDVQAAEEGAGQQYGEPGGVLGWGTAAGRGGAASRTNARHASPRTGSIMTSPPDDRTLRPLRPAGDGDPQDPQGLGLTAAETVAIVVALLSVVILVALL
jgi:hypothetical protein